MRLTLLLAVLVAGAAPLAAQDPVPPVPADTTRPTPADTARPAVDTSDVTGMLLRAQEDTRVRVPMPHRIGTAHLLPPDSRLILTRDSIEFMNAETIGDVLAEVPGVFLWRGGWLGAAESPNYLGRGASSVEWVVDGVPYTQLGLDSLTVDPSLLPIGWVDQIEIERLPGLLRVHLMFREQDVLAPWTRLAVGRGTYEQARYEAILQRRWAKGVGYTVGVSYNISNGYSPDIGDFQNAHAWLETSYLPSSRFGARLRWRLATPERDPSFLEGITPRDTLTRALLSDLSELEGRLFWAQRNDGLGRRTDLLVTRSAWNRTLEPPPKEDPDDPDPEPIDISQRIYRVGLVTTHRWPDRSLGAQLFYGSRWTRLDARVNGGWVLGRRASLALEGAWRLHDEGRSSRWAMARAGLSLPLGAALTGAWRVGEVVAAPPVPGDSAQALSDRELSATVDRSWVGLRATYTRTGALSPVPYYQFALVDTIGAQASTEWVTLHARLAPRPWLTVQGWYSDALTSQPEGTPPNHSVVTAAIRSKFLRTFPSGIFDLKLEIAMESWGSGTLGRTATGDPVTLDGATFFRGLIQLKLGQFQVYYDRYNLMNTRKTYHPGLRQPSQAYTFGIRWSFHN